MTPTDKWIDATYKELEKKINEQEDDFLNMFLDDYFSDFYVDDTRIKNSSGNYAKINEINKRFDDAYDEFILAFLLWYASKLLEAGSISLNYFKSIGVKATIDDIAYISKMIGVKGKTILPNSFLWNLGKMGEIRQKLQEKVMNAVSSSQKFNVFMRDVKPVFKSTKKKRSLLSKYYLKYAYQPIMQTLNGASYHLAKKYGMTKFKYAGELVEKSRSFCIHRKNKVFTIEEGNSWNQINWNGKIEGLDFFVQVGGWNCLDHLEYLSKSEENE